MDDQEYTDTEAGRIVAALDDQRRALETEAGELRALYTPAMALVMALLLTRMGHGWAAGVVPAAAKMVSVALIPLQQRYGDVETDARVIFERAGIPIIDVTLPEVETPAVDD